MAKEPITHSEFNRQMEAAAQQEMQWRREERKERKRVWVAGSLPVVVESVCRNFATHRRAIVRFDPAHPVAPNQAGLVFVMRFIGNVTPERGMSGTLNVDENGTKSFQCA